MEKTRSTKLISISLACLFVASVAASIYFALRNPNNTPPDDKLPVNIVNTITQNESFNDADAYVAFSLIALNDANISAQSLSIANQNGDVPSVTLHKTHIVDNEYTLNAPVGGYNSGDTYKIKLLDENVMFADESIVERRDITFSIAKPDIINVSQKSWVKDIQAEAVYSVSDDGNIIVDNDILQANSVDVGDIVILPIYDEYGFKTKVAYKVVGKNGNELSVEKPLYDEVFDELEIKGNFDAVYSSEYIHIFNDGEIAEELLNSEVVRALAASSESKSAPIPKIKVELKDGKVIISYEVEFPAFFKGLTFTIKGTAENRVGARADINILQGTFNIGGIVSYTNKYQFILKYEYKPTGKDSAELFKQATKKLTEILNEKVGEKELSLKAFEMYIPTPIPVLGFSFDVKIKFKLSLKVELQVTFTDEFSLEVGVKRDNDGLNPYFNKVSKRDAAEIELRGSIEAKLGLEVKFSGSAVGVLKAGISFEIGVYAKIAGFVKAKALMDLTLDNFKPSADPDVFVCYGFYFETGIYSSLSLFAEVDLKVVNYEARATLLEVKLPIFSIGYTQRIELIAAQESLVFDAQGKAPLPDIKVVTKDMFTGKTTEKNIKRENLKECFNISTDSVDFGIDNDNYVYIKNLSLSEFNGSVELKLHAWQSFMPDIKLEIGEESGTLTIEGKRGIWHYELGALFASTKINITKQPIAATSLILGYERVVEDDEYTVLHPEFSAKELKYNFREDIDGIKDFQIGHLVRVIPTFYPANNSYKTLTYTVEKGAQYIVGGESGIRTYNEGGITYAIFRIIDNPSAIGNIDGTLDLLKEIRLSARTNGYTGSYESMNITSTATIGIYASSIPTISYNFTPIVDNNSVAQTAVRPGDEVIFGILPDSVFPRNATRGVAGLETVMLLSGAASIIPASGSTELGKIKVNENAQIGDQIVLLASLSGVERYYYLNVVKKAVETIVIGSAELSVLPGDNRIIIADITGVDGGIPTISEAFFLIASGADLAQITMDTVNKNKAYLSVSASAKNGDIIEVIAIIDGQRSNTLRYAVTKTEVASVTLNTVHSLTVSKGDIISLSAIIAPGTATFNIPRYFIVTGGQYAIIDAQSGRLIITYAARGGEAITVKAEADSVLSNEITFTVSETAVNSIQFENASSFEYVRAGQAITLNAFVNADATEQGVTYTFETGSSYGSIVGNILTLNVGLSSFTNISVRATATDNAGIYITKTFSIIADLATISVNGRFDTVKLLATDSPYVVVTDINGDVIDNSLVTFRVENQFGGGTDLLTVGATGQLISNNNISAAVDDLFVAVYASYGGNEAYLTVEIILPPQLVEIVLKADNVTDEIGLKPNESAELVLKVTAQDNASPLTDIALNVIGNATGYISVAIGDFDARIYTIVLQVNDDAATGDIITLTAKYIIDGGYVESLPFIVTVLRLVDSIEIINAPTAMNIGESITLDYLTDPEIRHASARFSFVDSAYISRATLNEGTGLLIINNNAALIGYSIKVVVSIDGVFSVEYEIQIKDVVREITIGSDAASKGVQYITEMGFYVLYPNGEFIISKVTVGGGVNPNVTYMLDVIGQRYLNVVGNVITVKNIAINSGINATLIASVNGVISNLLVIYIPSVIRTTDDWFAIQNNINGYYVLGNDIDFAGVEYQPIRMFAGIIDGADFALRNITLDTITENNNVGLIEENYGIIINLSVRQLSVNLTREPEYGGIVYIGVFASRNYGYIINCKTVSTGMRLMYILIEDSYSAGIAGLNAGYIRLCENWIYIQTAGKVGGIAGKNVTGGEITDSFNAEILSANKYDETKAVVGIVGEIDGGAVENCHNYGKVFDMERWEYID